MLERDTLALEMVESRSATKDAVLRMRASEHKLLELVTETDTVLRFFPAQFPEASGLSVVAGRTYVAGQDGRPREATIRTALSALRRGLDDQSRVLQVLFLSHCRLSFSKLLYRDLNALLACSLAEGSWCENGPETAWPWFWAWMYYQLLIYRWVHTA